MVLVHGTNESEIDSRGTHHANNESIAAVIENRAKEVGIAIFATDSITLTLVQLIETSRPLGCRGYSNTLDVLSKHSPQVLIVVGVRGTNEGVNRATRAVYTQVALERRAFDDTQAGLVLETLVPKDTVQQLRSLQQSAYLSLGAAGALMHYLESDRKLILPCGSLRLATGGLQNHMRMGQGTVAALEIIAPLAGGCIKPARYASLYHFLNRTKTKLGARLLRANMLQPLTHVPTVEARLDTVEELVGDFELLFIIVERLNQMPKDLDRLCHNLAVIPSLKGNVGKRIGSTIHALILLRDTLAALPALAEDMGAAKAELLRAIKNNLAHPSLASMLQHILAVLDEDSHSHRQSFMNRTQHCFAIKNGADGLLDTARATFCRITEEIHALIESYTDEIDQNIKIKYTDTRGFFFVISLVGEGGVHVNSELPSGIIRLPCKKRDEIQCTTAKLNALNTRLESISNDCKIMTLQALDGLREKILSHMTILHKLADNLALLDMLSSFAWVVRESEHPYVRPRCTKEGPVAIVQGRHPLLELVEDMEYQPNDTYISDCSSFQILTGPNMSGKTTHLRQVACIVILAQLGMYVPAEFASIRCIDYIATRIGSSDSIETNSSTMMTEMQEMSQILATVTPRSLVLIDELGGSTATLDGFGIAWAVAEQMLSEGVGCLFSTHFEGLEALEALYPNCKLRHFQVACRETLKFDWKLQLGRNPVGHYGLLLGPMVNVPQHVLAEATRIASEVQSRRRDESEECTEEALALKQVYTLAHKIQCVLQAVESHGPDFDPTPQLVALQTEALGTLKTVPDAA